MPLEFSDAAPRTARDYLKILFRRLPVLILTVGLGTGVVVAGLLNQTPVYQAQVKMLISAKKQVESPYYRDLATNNNAEKITFTQSEIVKSAPVLERAVQALRLHAKSPEVMKKQKPSGFWGWLFQFIPQSKTRLEGRSKEEQEKFQFRTAVQKLRDNIEVQPIRDTNTFTISVKDANPNRAAVVANAVSRSYVIFDLEQQMAELQLKYGGKHPTVVQIRDHINRLFERLGGELVSNAEAIGPASVKIIEQAVPPLEPKGLSKTAVVAMTLFLTVVLGTLLAVISDFADPRLKSPEEIAALFGLPVIGSLPKNKTRRAGFVEALAKKILIKQQEGARTILVGAVDAPSSSAEIAAEIGKFAARNTQLRVLIVDTSFRVPKIHSYFKIPLNPGLKQVLAGNMSWLQASKSVQDHLTVIPAGGTGAESGVMDPEIWKNLSDTLKANFDLILLTSDSLIEEDVALLTSRVDKTALVVDECRTRKEVAKAAMQSLAPRKSELIGAIVNNRSFPIPKWIYDNI